MIRSSVPPPRGEDQDRCPVVPRAQAAEHLQTGLLWQIQVEDDDVPMLSNCLVEPFHAIKGNTGLVPDGPQLGLDGERKFLFIFDDQYPGPFS